MQLKQEKPTFDVEYNFFTGVAGAYKIGFGNNTINLSPKLNMDYTAIAAPNCTDCPSKNYDTSKSEGAGFLKRVKETEKFEVSIANTSFSVVLGGSWVTDTLSTKDSGALNATYSNKDTEVYEFFLIHNLTAGDTYK